MTTSDRVVKYSNLCIGLFGLVGVGLILFHGAKLKKEVTEMRPEVDAVVDWTNTSAARWQALEQYNQGKIAVPKVLEPSPIVEEKARSRPQILIVQPSPQPSPTVKPTPTPSPKPHPVKQAKRKKATPTPKPIFNWFKHKP